MQFREYAKLAAHIVGRLHPAPEGRAPQDEFAVAEPHKVGQVGMAARKLLDGDRFPAAPEVVLQERLEPGNVEFFAGPYGIGMVSRISHAFRASPSAIGEHRRIV
jgi:hypothetical protein